MTKKYKLVHTATKKPANNGDMLTTFRGEIVFLASSTPPAHEGSTGRIRVKRDPAENSYAEYFPGVCDLEFVLATEDERRTLMFDREKLEQLKAMRKEAWRAEELIFTWDGAPMRVDYAKYLIDYLETRLPK